MRIPLTLILRMPGSWTGSVPELRALYPPNWDVISRRIRHERAGNWRIPQGQAVGPGDPAKQQRTFMQHVN